MDHQQAGALIDAVNSLTATVGFGLFWLNLWLVLGVARK